MEKESYLSITDELEIEPSIEELTKEDLLALWRDIKREKPIQFQINTYCMTECDSGGCNFRGVVHKEQNFCPKCYHIMNTIEKDANVDYDKLIQNWIKKKNYIEEIINSSPDQFIKYWNENIEVTVDLSMGEEVIVDEDIEEVIEDRMTDEEMNEFYETGGTK